MTGLALLIWREVEARKLVLLLAAVIAFFPFILPLLPWMKGYDSPLLRATSALSLSAGIMVGLALILGATMIGRDLSEKRLGFYFSRPLSALSLWFGKLGGATLLIIVVTLVVLLPAFLVALLTESRTGPGMQLFLQVFQLPQVTLLLAGVLALLGLTHALSVLARAQSVWIILPLLSGLVAAAIVWRTAVPQLLLGKVFLVSSLVLLGSILIVLLVAGLLQLQLGRADLKLGARVLALALSTGLLAGAAGHAGYSAWVLAATPSDLGGISWTTPGGSGDWVHLSGIVKRGGVDYESSFLLDTSDGNWLCTSHASSVAFSPDGTRVAWEELVVGPLARNLLHQVKTIDLAAENSEPRAVLTSNDWVRSMALSPDGRRLALVSENDLQVYELVSGRLLAAARLDDDLRQYQLIFTDPDLVRVYWAVFGTDSRVDQPGGNAVLIAELDMKDGAFRQTGTIPGAAHGLYRASWSRDASRMVLRIDQEENSHIALHDGRTGQEIAVLCGDDRPGWKQAKYLFDERMVALRVGEDRSELILFSAGGIEEQSIPVAPGMASLDGETTPGVMALRVYAKENQFDGQCYLVNLDTGQSRSLGQGMSLLTGRSRQNGIHGAWPPPGSPGSTHFIEQWSRLVRLDPATGERTVIVGEDG